MPAYGNIAKELYLGLKVKCSVFKSISALKIDALYAAVHKHHTYFI